MTLELPRGSMYPILPLRDIVVFPYMVVPLFVGRERSVRALESVMQEDQEILLVTQKDASLEEPKARDLYTIGTLGRIMQLLKLPDGTVKILVEGHSRARILRFSEEKDFFQGSIEILDEVPGDATENEALMRTAVSLFEQYLKLNTKIPPDLLLSVSKIDQPEKLADTLASHLAIRVSEKQDILEISNVNDRLERVCAHMEGEIAILQTEKRIRGRVKRQMEKSQREYYLNEQMKAIQKELGDSEDGQDEISALEDRISKTKLSKEAKEKATSELRKLRAMNPMSSEATVVRNYLEWLLDIPWKKPTKVKKDLASAEKILDEDHYGLKKVKERIVEYLAVQARVGQIKGPILCLVGAPGVGKTSLGQSIAKATGRSFVRISLGGVRDEAEIRGHRRTYIGSMPGKVIQGMKKAKSSNPLFLLDEIDKLGADWRGDPASALLEVLDPEQNSTFNDHYLEVDYDLSDVMFVTTANSLNMPQPLLDRMEIIRLSGYTEEEKLEIVRHHLIPKQMKSHGLKKEEWRIEDAALIKLIRLYTRESGVRNLEREIANLLRKATKELMTTQEKTIAVTVDNLEKFAGIPRYRYGVSEIEDQVGATTGLAWTEVGGELLTVEAVLIPGKGKMTTTGKLGEVMQESVQAAASYVRSRARHYGINPELFEKNDIHVHVPEGAIPKDGPSAGIAMCTTIISLLTGIPVRKDVAMTGEVTLRGRVLAIGGLKEKLLAAHRGGIKRVLIPEDNRKDLADIPENATRDLEIICVEKVEQVIEHALIRETVPLADLPPVSADHQPPVSPPMV
ncbi:MAG: endopeptidase La [Alphaproteobacteria bacterium]|jgi:ATP-dependent Lon protease|nr:endopeptidase La [Alphaproteobacteria bacterium]